MMASTPHSFRQLLLTALMAVSMAVMPLASVGHESEDGEHLVCVETMQARESSCCPAKPIQVACCDGESHKLPRKSPHGELDSLPVPCGDEGDCSCCVTISSPVVLGMMFLSDRTVADTAVHRLMTVTHTPDRRGWHHRLLRPPIC